VLGGGEELGKDSHAECQFFHLAGRTDTVLWTWIQLGGNTDADLLPVKSHPPADAQLNRSRRVWRSLLTREPEAVGINGWGI
jgi:hypothetical protein